MPTAEDLQNQSDKLSELIQKTLSETKLSSPVLDHAPADYPTTSFELFKGNDLLFVSLRRFLFDVLGNQMTQDVEEEKFEKLYHFLDLCLVLSERELVEANAPFLMIEDVIDLLTISACERVFEYLERRRDHVIQGLEPTRGKGIVLLRFCNELMRRTAKTKHTVLCGRVLIYLASLFPLTERSGVNLRGDFNVDNVTFYETNTMEVDGQDQETSDLYDILWGLCKFFSQPLLLAEAGNLKQFKEGFDKVYKAFKALNDRKGSKSSSKTSQAALDATASNEPEFTFFFPKYLTGYSLFPLELQDSQFRCQLIIQFWIVLQFLSLQTTEAKEMFKQTSVQQNAVLNRNLAYTMTLTAEDSQWISDAVIKCITLIERSSSKGKTLARTVAQVMLMEKNWGQWKAFNCPSFEKPMYEGDAATALSLEYVDLPIRSQREWESIERPSIPEMEMMEQGEEADVSDVVTAWKMRRLNKFSF